ncbi:hypothetical protein CDD81_1023 [Ophiocordyceps australis]|uniref:GH16 domain-containing protein n=1 Tax=Ophiocordyceps australis TaxID=1399860 RepID=A0A2C5Y119_9HYPO|nr:hypothetical protein CDD81_1023 [Ophiocordyceps australis]
MPSHVHLGPLPPDAARVVQSHEAQTTKSSSRPYEIVVSSNGRGFIRRARKDKAWWDPGSWPKSVCAAMGFILIILAIVLASALTKDNTPKLYPDYAHIPYTLRETYEGETFFDHFNYFADVDPSHGFVNYLPRPLAKRLNLTYATPSTAIVRVDTSVGPQSIPDASTGRFSVRLESKRKYNGGLFIFDVKHTPYACGAWPALWLTDTSDWPAKGEIDVMEAVNEAKDGNLMSLHTRDGCSMAHAERRMTGIAQNDECDAGKNNNAGCGVATNNTNLAASFGPSHNAAGGSVMALEWRHDGIRIWQFGRNAIPRNLVEKMPNPTVWGTAAADFPNTHCEIASRFQNHSIIVNINLCGDMVHATWKESGCPSICADLVASRPELYKTAYWEFGAFDIYQPTRKRGWPEYLLAQEKKQ